MKKTGNPYMHRFPMHDVGPSLTEARPNVGGAARRSAAKPRGPLGYKGRSVHRLLGAGFPWLFRKSSEPRMAKTILLSVCDCFYCQLIKCRYSVFI